MHVHGRCHCGAIDFEGEVQPGTVLVCHCTDCQTLSGSAYRTGIFATADSFKLSGTRPTIYVKTGTSGAKRAHAFCPSCGTPIYSSPLENPERYTLRVGTLAERAELGLPMRQGWCDSALPWSGDLSNVPKMPKQ